MQFLKRNDSGVWVITAAEGEFHRADANICYTGIGKVNTAIATQKLIDVHAPRLVINLSTAGSSSFDYGTIVNCAGFVQRDMNPTEFLAPKYVVPMSDDAPVLEYGDRDDLYPAAICGGGDYEMLMEATGLRIIVNPGDKFQNRFEGDDKAITVMIPDEDNGADFLGRQYGIKENIKRM